MTATVIYSAQGSSHKNDKGEVIVDKPSKPCYYAFIPLTVAGDAATLPFQLVAGLMLWMSGIKC